MHYEILDEKRSAILPLLNVFKDQFYLAGGTGLALQIGHRDSVDFDFFSQTEINTSAVFEQTAKAFAGHKIIKAQEEAGTLTVFIDDSLKLSFFFYPYELVNSLISEPYLNIASIEDIACMKLSAITGRGTNKDYIDLYYILKMTPLKDILSALSKKLPGLDENLVLKSLVFFDDLVMEPINFKSGGQIDFEEIKDFLKNQVKKIAFP
ncbi:MAG TPA: nucleotidyl transferase AbiEii/AbiGii toxin family protein [Candidatus Paceibacterota bacterium]|nr:nucleotidyl transferase AbiEii/AbiGii toxin family protein [Candidatus Pacearchaeota archaeon]HRZ50561.1 nucleotidyl transferase AbiEii/AbiGii toxin family protein [Candidatus Paceibacterota bacterium]HSA36282.1 nucleotidyl transferase AbiEii/AbiGii toxin family protein [Candidatus Paceibacterota bacterium]